MPPAYTAAQKAAIQQVVNFTNSDRTTAARILRNHNWNAEQAINGTLLEALDEVNRRWMDWIREWRAVHKALGARTPHNYNGPAGAAVATYSGALFISRKPQRRGVVSRVESLLPHTRPSSSSRREQADAATTTPPRRLYFLFLS
ncbi:hypothetical protein HDK77DRAFT_483098 [Phyllosticta capitalensis]